MKESYDQKIIEGIEAAQKEWGERFEYIDDVSKLPDRKLLFSGPAPFACDLKLQPRIVFHLLELLLQKVYVDLYRQLKVVHLDDKVGWGFVFKTKNGFFELSDWKGYKVKIRAFKPFNDIEALEEDIKFCVALLSEHTEKYSDYEKHVAKKHLAEHPLDNFMKSWFAIRLMYDANRELAEKQKIGWLETLILQVSYIDTTLRYIILLTRINNNRLTGPRKEDVPLFFQQDKSYISERSIFDLAKKEVDLGLNDDEHARYFERLHELYNFRNRAVHQYAVTNVQYSDIREAVVAHQDLVDPLLDVVVRLEHEQVELGCGYLRKEDIDSVSEEEGEEILDTVIQSKVDPASKSRKMPVREAMFSDKYKGGINPKIRHIVKKFEKELKKTHEWKKAGDGKYSLRQRKTKK